MCVQEDKARVGTILDWTKINKKIYALLIAYNPKAYDSGKIWNFMLLHKVRNICKRENDHTNNSGNVNNHSLTFLIIKTIKKTE